MTSIQTYNAPSGIPLNPDFLVQVRSDGDTSNSWHEVPAYAVNVAKAKTSGNDFELHTVAVSSFDFKGPVEIRVTYTAHSVHKFVVRPQSSGIESQVHDDTLIFKLSGPRDLMVEIDGDRWKALHLLTNAIHENAPTQDSSDIWFFGPGINQGSAYAKVEDGINLVVPSGKTVYLAGGAFITFRLNFVNVCNSAVRGHGFILGPKGGCIYREHGGSIHMSHASNIHVEGVTSLETHGFSLSAGECADIHIDRYRSFSSSGNGDGVDFFCSKNVTIENCFLRNSDDTIALYSHRWNWYGDSTNILIQNCVFLPDIAHAINMGTHGNPQSPETTSNVTIRNIDILDHDESQVWYQGCIAINVADMNLFHDIHIEDIRVERITNGQLFNLRVMQNNMWTTAPGRGIRNVTFKNLSFKTKESRVVNPSMILGYDTNRNIENVSFQNLSIDNKVIYEAMQKPRWYMVTDFVPLFVNEHVKEVKFHTM